MRIVKGLVSVIMPAYNAEKTINRSLNSILEQSYSNFELFIIDDCSSDKTLQIINSYNDERIILIKNDKNLGAPKSRNKAIEKARGEFICFQDADDEWHLNKIQMQVDFLRETKAPLSAHGYKMIKESGKSIVYSPPRSVQYKDLLKYNVISNCATMLNMNVIGKKIFFKDLNSRQDHAMSLEITKKYGPAKCIPDILLKVFIQTNSVSSNKFQAILDQWYLYRNVEKINLISSLILIISWALKGYFKYSKFS